MKAERVLAAEETLALGVGIARDVIGQGDNKGLPRPRFIVSTLAFYAILSLIASVGEGAARFAAAAGGAAAAVIVVSRPGAAAISGLLGGLTRISQVDSAPQGAAPGAADNLFGNSRATVNAATKG